MPEVLRHEGYRFFFYSNEGNPREPPHVHVERDGRKAKVWLGQNAPELAGSKGFSRHELLDIIRIVSWNRDRMMERWNGHFR